MKLEYPPGATPLDPNEVEGLRYPVNTQGELNELEKANIRIGYEWAKNSRKLKKLLLTYSGLMILHKRLFGDVWEWAGGQRKTEKNIGVSPHKIAEEVNKLCEDTKYWIENMTYDWDTIGARFHHRLVVIHPFPNGNGRLGRIATDLLFLYNQHELFTWGAKDLVSESKTRSKYIHALQAADRGEYSALLEFVRS